MVTINDVLRKHNGKIKVGTQLRFKTVDKEGKTTSTFTLGKPRKIPAGNSNVHRQGTRRYCPECKNVMLKTKVTGLSSKSVRAALKLYKCPKGHTIWGL